MPVGKFIADRKKFKRMTINGSQVNKNKRHKTENPGPDQSPAGVSEPGLEPGTHSRGPCALPTELFP